MSMLSILLTIVGTYLVITLFGHSVHWILHQRWAGKINVAHMTHHLKLYPPSDFLSDTYRQAGKDSTPKFFLIIGAPLIVGPVILWWVGWLPLSLMITILLVEAVMSFLFNYLHDAFHIRNHWLSRAIPTIFGRWVRLHRQHHSNMKINFGIYDFLWDRVFRTYRP